jgi:hypothetical protein
LPAAREQLAGLEADAVAGLSRAEIETLEKLLGRVLENLRSVRAE